MRAYVCVCVCVREREIKPERVDATKRSVVESERKQLRLFVCERDIAESEREKERDRERERLTEQERA